MKALAISTASRSVELVDRAQPRITEPSMVRVRTLEVGVCGTDAELCAFDYGEPPRGEDVLIAGHEALGVVEEVGPAVEHLEAGDLVVPSVRRPCGHSRCTPCATGNQDYCVTGDYTERGIKGAHGFLAEEFVDDERYLHIVPPELREIAVLTEPLTIAEKALEQYTAIQRRLPWLREAGADQLVRGRRAIVLGAGPVALLGAMLLIERGVSTWVYSRGDESDAEARIATAFGATYVSSRETEFEALDDDIGQVDLIYEATGASELALQVMSHLDPNAVCILTGVPTGERSARVRSDAMMKRLVLRNQVVAGTVNASSRDFVQAIRDLGRFEARWPAVIRRLITERAPMECFCRLAGSKRGIKQVIRVSLLPIGDASTFPAR
jgi:threonine dehydrogenase-like Zn-dependent dehydrogenase